MHTMAGGYGGANGGYGGGNSSPSGNSNSQKIQEEKRKKEEEIQRQLKEQREKHMVEMNRIQSIISDLKSKGQGYSNIATQSQEVLRQNNEAVAGAIQSRSNINLSQEQDSQNAIDEKKKNRSRVGTGISKADML